MDPDRWKRAQALFAEAVDMSADTRERWLADACQDDAAMRREVASLLDADAAGAPLFSRLDHLADTARRGQKTAPKRARTEFGPGDKIGRFRLARTLGSGGMGVVFLATPDDGSEAVALKLVRGDSESLDLPRRLAREAEVLERFRHPSIARLIETGTTTRGIPYLVMEYVEGETIVGHCAARELTVRARVELLIAACDAVAYAHAQGVVHRDLKPAHVVVRADGSVVLLDFGIAKLIDDAAILTAPGVRLCTPDYAAPEQLAGLAVGPAVDVYALGAIAFELLTGRLPFDLRAEGKRARVLKGELPAEEALDVPSAGVSPALDAILTRALEIRPEARYRDAAGLGAALTEAIA